MTKTRSHTVVIGAGIAGLAAALKLAGAGHEVTVLERHETPGGKMRTLPSAAGPVDAGPTVMTMRPVFEALFADVGARLSDHVTLHREEILARHFWSDGSMLDLHADPDMSVEAVHAFAGAKAARQFRAFSDEAARLFDAFDGPMMQNDSPTLGALTAQVLRNPGLIPALAPHATLAKRLQTKFDDPRLRQLFGRYATYVGGSPYASPAVLALIWQSEAHGVWRVDGGMHQLAQAIAALTTRLGAQIHYGAHVAEIEVTNGDASAVTLENGTRIAADQIVFNGDPRALYTGMLGQTVRAAVRPQGTEPRSLSAYVWSFAAKAMGAPLRHHNIFFGDTAHREFDTLSAGKIPEDPTLYICAEDRGHAVSAPITERFEIIMNGPPALAPAPVEEFAICQTRTFPRLARMGLKFDHIPGPESLTTPHHFAKLFPGSTGSLYGRSPDGLMASFQRPHVRSKISKLYLAGGGVHPGAGIPMAALCGRHAAAAILNDQTSTSASRQGAMPGGTSTALVQMAPAPSQSSPS